ncbi:MAG: ABC transporter substrate-binding protein [Deltaproteobacteria bacterium]|nr:ABC transporter substrate-binding protein [Deltaproteobacteria bacterium]MBI2179265.1 ABC transporter substrate-binding protein [Deltaproteobacteria bacterium]MBI2534057.1 ABC transporter substrate-binding protein [Deltaproteobacteria bacterium]
MKKFALAAVALGLLFLSPAFLEAQVKDLSWGTSAVGTSGHRALVSLAALLNREMPAYRVAVLPTPGAIATVKGYATGQFDGYYGSDIAFHELAGDTARFKGFRAQMKRAPVQSFWAFTLEVGLGILARDRNKVKQWSDLSGERVFTGPLPFDTRATLERAMAAAGAKHNYVEIDLAVAGSALDRGDIKALTVYTAGHTALPPWLVEAQLGTDLAVLNPSKSEIDLIRKAGMQVVEVSPSVFKKSVHVDKMLLVPFFYGFHVGLEIPENDVHRMLIVVEKHVDELVKSDKSFSQIKTGMPQFQRSGVESAVNDVLVHPGLARYLKDRGVWEAKWDKRIAKAK